jgi:hypothetical protein
MAFVKIQIDEYCKNEEEMAELLKVIAKFLEEGCTSGYKPDWHIVY